jgi:xanthine dehydrogenase YagR molybdenum-binding subunit
MAAEKMEIPETDVMLKEGVFSNRKDPEQQHPFKEVLSELRREKVFHGEYDGRPSEYAYNTFGAHFAEVEVDTDTGQVRVLRVVAAHDIGRVINTKTAESQIIGGVTQGVGYALFEQRIMDQNTGTMVNANLRDYKIPTSKDIPEIEPIFADNVDPHINIMGTKGLGEPPMIPIAAAIANAVYNAIGVHPREIPMTPDRILAAMKRKEEG